MTNAATKTEVEESRKGVTRLVDMETREVSLVDHPANKQRFLIIKRADGTDERVAAPVTAPVAELAKQAVPTAQESSVTTTNSSSATPAVTIPVPAPAAVEKSIPVAPVIEKSGRAMNGDRLNRLKGLVTMFKAALGELKNGSVSLEKFDHVAKGLSAIVGECDVAKYIEKAKAKKSLSAALGGDGRTASPTNPNAGAGVQPDTASLAGPAAIFGASVPSEVVATMKRHELKLDELAQQNKKLSAEIEKREKTIGSLTGEVESLKKFREAPSSSSEEEFSINEDSGSGDDVVWGLDMAADLEAERAALSD